VTRSIWATSSGKSKAGMVVSLSQKGTKRLSYIAPLFHVKIQKYRIEKFYWLIELSHSIESSPCDVGLDERGLEPGLAFALRGRAIKLEQLAFGCKDRKADSVQFHHRYSRAAFCGRRNDVPRLRKSQAKTAICLAF
jgi:hypothetical protein